VAAQLSWLGHRICTRCQILLVIVLDKIPTKAHHYVDDPTAPQSYACLVILPLYLARILSGHGSAQPLVSFSQKRLQRTGGKKAPAYLTPVAAFLTSCQAREISTPEICASRIPAPRERPKGAEPLPGFLPTALSLGRTWQRGEAKARRTPRRLQLL